MRVILADAGACFERLRRRGIHVGDAGLVIHLFPNRRHQRLHGRRAVVACLQPEGFREAGQVFVLRRQLGSPHENIGGLRSEVWQQGWFIVHQHLATGADADFLVGLVDDQDVRRVAETI